MSLSVEDGLARLKSKYILSLPGKIDDIQKHWIKAQDIGDADSLREMYRLTHSMAGSGATFDQMELSQNAKKLELYLKENGDKLFTKDISNHVNNLLAVLKGIIDNCGDEAEQAPSQGLIDVVEKENSLPKATVGIKILLADDDEYSRAKIATILSATGHKVFEASNGQEALECFAEHQPDLVLLDVVMPVMNGYTAAKIMKEQSAGQFIPIIFLTAITDNESLAACISAGGDDFLNKPIHPIILNAKIEAMQRIKEAYKKLDEYQRKTEEELETSEHLFDSLLYCNHDEIENLSCWSIFPGHFSGDLQLSARLQNGDTYILLCDFTGHGLPAALGTMFVADLFQNLTKQQVAPELILDKINAKMHHILPVGRYCAAVMVAINKETGEVSIWNNGLPTAYLLDSEHRMVREFPSAGLALGILASFNSSESTIFKPQEGCSLVFYSDGVTEAENFAGEMYSEQRFYSLLEQMPAETNLFDGIKKALSTYTGDTELVDDLSVMVLTF